ncbi:MAG: rpoE 2 [Gemmataceae bacterium]|nr:rpoE 2 [Gemmataceae bacterium]
MPHPALSAVVARVGRAALCDEAATDGQLLTHFARTKDEAAIAELVRRLGPMVLGVCRRMTGDTHLAEDAFQAAFLVLARRAADVRPAEAVRGWVYGVAVRTAREARAVSARRLARERPVPVVPDRPADPVPDPDADALRALDEEVAGLPDHLRAVVVLCELDGVGRKVAAARLDIPVGTVSSRLAKARKVLARRLRGRGIALPAAGLAVAGRAAAVPPRLVNRTAALAAPSAAVPTAVAVLSQGVFRTMFLHKLTAAIAGGVLLAVALVAGSRLSELSAQEPSKPPVPHGAGETKVADGKKPPPAAKPAGPGTLLLGREGDYWALTPAGKKVADLDIPGETRSMGQAKLSPDGARVALLVCKEEAPRADRGDEPWPIKVVVRKAGEADPGTVFDFPAQALGVCWTADGTKLVVARQTTRSPDPKFESVLVDPATGKTEPLALPAGVRVLDCGRDGKTFVVQAPDPKTGKPVLGLATTGGADVRVLAELRTYPGGATACLSPDGKTVLLIDGDPARKHFHKWGLSQRPYRVDVATGRREVLADFPENGQACGAAWAPDGKRIAYTWKQLHEELFKKDQLNADETTVETEAFLIVADADGKNPKTVASDKGPYAINMILAGVDWR